METVAIKETSTRYLIEVDRESMEKEPTILHREGQPVAAIVPIDEYRAYREWKAAHPRPSVAVPSDFEAEMAAFERLRPELLESCRGRAVAIYQGQVVEVGDDKRVLLVPNDHRQQQAL